ncbi:hypothetical protein KO498_09760 [Lentibacter algarum]|uniref:hypothetical protein n=1 Tax=Lentibacter algarum TaxID=576131 RepID=UPI001C068DD0|nr:hypothetical protein [Lentibacter algarum]MBU2982096.1 hypothetical protein [Lentibacter algarum]
MSSESLTYAGGAEEVIAQWNARREPFTLRDGDFPAVDVDLAPFKNSQVAQSAVTDRAHKSKWTAKRCLIAREFTGKTELAFLNAQLISNLRRKDCPDSLVTLFRRIWAEESEHLMAELDLRWQVSSIITFADHGQTPAERELGLGLKMLFGMIKLYEFERLFSGQPPNEAWRFGNRASAEMPLEMDQYSLNHGGLDSALLAPLWLTAQSDNIAGPLAQNLLNKLNAETSTIFRRLTTMKARRAKQRAAKESRT